MSSRVEAKQRLREERRARERDAEEKQRRTRRLLTLGGVAGVAAIAVAVLIAVSQSGGAGGSTTRSVSSVNPLFAGIPQQGAVLGRADAPVTMVEYVDLQCPFCRDYTTGVLPTLVDRYVRTGDLRIELRPVAILGADSQRGAAAAQAAAKQNRMWQFADAFYLSQGQENTGYVTDDFLRQVAADSGVQAAAVVAAANSGETIGSQGVQSTPSFLLGKTGGTLKPLEVTSLDPSAFTGPIDRQLAR